jgi:hemolysin D
MKSPETIAELCELTALPGGRRARRLGDELEFLPAALELLERPASPWARGIAFVIVALVASAVLWASLGHVDVVATAEGKIVPNGQVKTIQPFEIGVVKRLLVHDGERVTAGQILIELDPTSNIAEQERIARDLDQARLDVARLQALLAGPAQPFRVPDGFDPAVVEAEQHMLEAERQEQEAKLAELDRALDQKRSEQAGARATVDKLTATIPLIAQRVDGMKELLEKQYASRFSYLEMQQKLVDQQHELIVQQHRVDELGSAVAALQRQRDETVAGLRKSVLDRLIKARQQQDQLVQDAIKARQRTALQSLKAPVDGTVQQLAIHTVGGVVTPAEPLLVVVPADRRLEVEARIANRDIGFVHAGQEAEVKVETFDFTHYGIVHGTVVDVSRDAVPPDDKDPKKEPAYLARVSLDRTSIDVEGRPVALGAGMSVTAEVKTGRRRLIEYLLSPVLRYREQTLRER